MVAEAVATVPTMSSTSGHRDAEATVNDLHAHPFVPSRVRRRVADEDVDTAGRRRRSPRREAGVEGVGEDDGGELHFLAEEGRAVFGRRSMRRVAAEGQELRDVIVGHGR